MYKYLGALLVLVCQALFIYEVNAFEIKNVSVNYRDFMNLDISSRGINRINFGDERIDKIIGDNSEFTAVVSDNGDNLFLTSKVGSENTIGISVQFINGKTIDITLHVIDSNLPSIIEMGFKKESRSDELHKEAEAMLVAMIAGKIGKYYVQDVSNKFKLGNNPHIHFKQLSSYRYGNLRGAAYLVTNKSRASRNKSGAVTIDNKALSSLFSKSIVTAVENELLVPAQQTMAYVVIEMDKDGNN